jgi:energy-coupling factor transporter ATP-binding protein EcfA2
MIDSATNPKQNFSRLYSDVAGSIAAAMDHINKLEVDYKNGKDEIGNMLERLRGMQSRFNHELGMLEEHSEWEKFTIAFFGETNAGKSTIIESLRILFEEESRQRLLQQNARDLLQFENALTNQVDTVRQGLRAAHGAYAGEVAALRYEYETSARALIDKSAAHVETISHKFKQLTSELQARAASVENLAQKLAQAVADSALRRQEIARVEGERDRETATREDVQAALVRTEIAGLAERNAFALALATARRNARLAGVAGIVIGGLVVGLIVMVIK